MVIYLVIVAAVGVLFLRMPTAYLPDEDQGILMAQVMLPTGSTLEQTQEGPEDSPALFPGQRKGGGRSCMTIAGYGFSGTGPDQRHGVRQAQGLEAPRPAGPEGQGHRRNGP